MIVSNSITPPLMAPFGVWESIVGKVGARVPRLFGYISSKALPIAYLGSDSNSKSSGITLVVWM
jgi:hypothetical protein